MPKHTPTKEPKEPPDWWNARGKLMGLSKPEMPTRGTDLILMPEGSFSVRLVVRRLQQRPKFILDWAILHEGGLDQPYSRGRIELSMDEFEMLFGNDDDMRSKNSLWLIQRYGGTVAVQGKFLRWGPYLCIPGPGTGEDGDANLSVYITKEIRLAAKAMLLQKEEETNK